MEFLNQKATIVFIRLVESLGGGLHRKIENTPFMPLTIESIGENIDTPWGMASLYSLCHYCKQNGDLMQDPEMCFFIIDNRNGATLNNDNVKIAPYSFQQANMGIYEESVRMENAKLTEFNRNMQKDHTEFANMWLSNIEEQGFLTA